MSRGEFAEAERLGWRFIDFNFEPIYELLIRYLRSGSLVPTALVQQVEDYAQQEGARLWL